MFLQLDLKWLPMSETSKKPDSEIIHEIDAMGDDFYVLAFQNSRRLHFDRMKTFNYQDLDDFKSYLERWKAIYTHVIHKLSFEEARIYKSMTKTRVRSLKSYQKIDIVIEDIESFEKDILAKPEDSLKAGQLVKSKRNEASNVNPDENNLTAPQKALIAIYKGEVLTRKEHGDYLYNTFCELSKTQNRIGGELTQKKLNNKIERLKSVIEYLPPNKHDMVNTEIQTLKSKLVKK